MKQLNKHSIPLSALIIGIISLIFVWGTVNGNSQNNSILGITQTSNGEVTVDLTPVKFKNGKLQVKIAISTHSVDDLHRYNLKKIVTLNNGLQTISPSSVPRLGGHHNNGKLVFNIETLPEELSIQITNLHDKGVREFNWPQK